MTFTRRNVLKQLALGIPALQLQPAKVWAAMGNTPAATPPHVTGNFEATRASLRQYTVPGWFRDAKFGIWAHWGPQSAIEAGDWYARNMYMQGSRQYDYHVKTYGHPSQFGYKDTIPRWKAEAFDADYLLGLYKNAGAKYFMSMGVHHDNFDLWNSKHNAWNAVNMGPKKDIVGLFKKAADKHGLKFGVSDHLWISYKWFSTSKGSDSTGPLAGIPYDGANPKFFDLYGKCEQVFNHKLDWNENWIPQTWRQHWYNRMMDLVNQYQPDLLYCDGHMPFEEFGLSLLAHLYNTSAAKNNGITQAVYTSKRPEDSAEKTGICVYDVERGVVDSIWPQPWQTDTCIGDWHYNKSRVGKYKTAKTVIDMLVDIVSRNGNLMLNIPLPASGMPDVDELHVLEEITQWMKVNSEGIYATRPWKIFGDGPLTAISKNEKEVNSALQFNENSRKDFSYQDVRFTTKNGVLYAFIMGWPDDKPVVIAPLGLNSAQQTGEITGVELLGGGKLHFSRDGEGLKIIFPQQKPCAHAYCVKITGSHLL
ncbi:MAG: alpha-L-fucosidase [Bacteroidetes bacterium]|nr:alpha-L-fucosidase [Bacteroidota bacterium]